ncbi:MAG: hypothetical protein H8F28_26075 [Fibrella sp.]|nr:hypothetical protein [Armatimonadota bacterium]
MTDMLAAAQTVRDRAMQPTTSFASLPPTDEAAFAGPGIGRLLRGCRHATEEERNNVLLLLAPAIENADPFEAGRIAIVCGSVVEFGANPRLVVHSILARLPEYLALAAKGTVLLKEKKFGLVAPSHADVFKKDPAAYGAWRNLKFLLLAAMTTLCRDAGARQVARQNPEIRERLAALEEVSAEANYLSQVLALTDDMMLVVLHPEHRRGYRVRLEGVSTNFHLFTLLQDAVIGDPAQGWLAGPPPEDPEVIAIATGTTQPETAVSDSSRLHFYDHSALSSDGTVNAGSLESWIWGEGEPSDIPPFENERIVLIGPPALASRSWDCGFFANLHDALRSEVAVTEVMDEANVTGYLDRLRRRQRP